MGRLREHDDELPEGIRPFRGGMGPGPGLDAGRAGGPRVVVEKSIEAEQLLIFDRDEGTDPVNIAGEVLLQEESLRFVKERPEVDRWLDGPLAEEAPEAHAEGALAFAPSLPVDLGGAERGIGERRHDRAPAERRIRHEDFELKAGAAVIEVPGG